MNIEQEIRDQIERNKELKQEVGYINTKLSVLEGLCRKDKDDAYQRGLEDGKKAFDLLDAERDSEYQRGLEDAWNVARKIAVETDDGGVSISALYEMFGTESMCMIMKNNTVHDAIAKLKAYEEHKDDAIKAGNEVIWRDTTTFIVTAVYKDGGFSWCDGISQDGRVFHVLLENVRKTGKHYDIQSILEAMKNG